MNMTAGTDFNHYSILGPLGAGGMGEVYRATDTKLKREVALKVLPSDFAADAERLSRFQREAEMLAALNHANIAQIHGIETCGGVTALIMELIEGPTLAERIEHGALPPEEALNVALQICAALEAAHERGIVHRDLKPANIKLKTDGTVKVLDFGIAKVTETNNASGRHSPTMVTPAVTESGVILGTAAYMSPEQARGKPVDARSDIWAFGCVLYEMLTGQPAFGGEDVMTTLARVLDRDSDLSSIPATISPAVRHTIQLCLKKDPRKRIADIRDVRLALSGGFDVLPSLAEAANARAARFWSRALPLALVLAAAGSALTWFLTQPQPAPKPVARFVHTLEQDQALRNTGRNILALSPDGRRFVYNTTQGLFLRELDQDEAHLIPGTEAGVFNPIFSPDGQHLAYWTVNSVDLMRISITGGAPVQIASATSAVRGANWEADNTILFGSDEGVYRVSANGGVPELVVTSLEEGLFSSTPELLPDGEHLLHTSGNSAPSSQIVATSLSTGEHTLLVPAGRDAHYLTSGHLTYVYENTLFAIAFDANTLTVSGSPVPLVQEVTVATGSAPANYDIARDGTLVFQRGVTSVAGTTLAWVDREGREEALDMPPQTYSVVRVSPDGTRFVTTIAGDVWVGDIARKVLNRITDTEESETEPRWSPDGKRLVFAVNLKSLSWTSADGTEAIETLFTEATATNLAPGVWTPDGTLFFTIVLPDKGAQRLGRVSPYAQQERPVPWDYALDRAHGAAGSALSGDGKWLSYHADDTGSYGIYIERYPELGERQLVSDAVGGWGAIWPAGANELFYRRLGDGAMMRVPVALTPALEVGTAELLFDNAGYTPVAGASAGGGGPRNWDIAPDGRFLMQKASGADSRAPTEFVIVQNWTEELKRLVPTK